MITARVKARAKINLTLAITGVRDGFHLLDSFVASLDLADQITLKKRKDKQVNVTMRGVREPIDLEKNTAYLAARRFLERFSTDGADIAVSKNIPMAAGLGGSSADAAGVLVGMAKLYGVTDERAVGEIADSVGSDVKYMLQGGFCRMQGRGERLFYLDKVTEKLYFLLLCPETGVSSGACYKKYDEIHPEILFSEPKQCDQNTEKCIDAFLRGEVQEAGRYLMNELFEPAAALNPDVLTAMEEVRAFSPLGACMTGSGSAVFAAFESRELRDWAKSRYRGKFRLVCAETDARREEL
ncbi:MAG: 4-(cytidine 5'-diphospho)-2-C-methyl-D-erythritol kinase [Clostridia bacterium]|nr:4-(cytidine 5'-diphospho)-2-C-methyl-D-erythritol kinase [Clostridia bacterium]